MSMDITQIRTRIIERMADPLPMGATESGLSQAPALHKEVDGFFKAVGRLIEVQQEWDAAKQKIVYTEENNGLTDYIDPEVISYELVSRSPGTFEKAQPGAGSSIKMRKPRLLGTVVDEANPQYNVLVLQQWWDNTVSFSCWAKSLTTISTRVSWLEDLLTVHAWFLETSGYKFRYEELGPKMIKPIAGGGAYVGRSIFYWLRTTKTFRVSEKRLEQLVMDVSINKE